MKRNFCTFLLIFVGFTVQSQSIYDIANEPLLNVTSNGHVTSPEKKLLAFITGNALLNKDSSLIFELKPNGDVFRSETKTVVGNISSAGKVTDAKGNVLGYISSISGTISDADRIKLGYYNAGIIKPNWCAVLFFFYQAFK